MGSGIVDERQVLELAGYRRSDAFTDLERAVLEYADRLTATPAGVAVSRSAYSSTARSRSVNASLRR